MKNTTCVHKIHISFTMILRREIVPITTVAFTVVFTVVVGTVSRRKIIVYTDVFFTFFPVNLCTKHCCLVAL